MEQFDPGTVFRLIDVVGVVANGILGAAVARAKGFDIVGFIVLSIASGLGGGMIRDVLLQSGPPVALTDPAYLSSALGACAIAYVVDVDSRWARRALIVADMLVMGCWSATGTAKALGVGLGLVPAILLGVTTAVGGGMVRDVLVGEVPRVFGGQPLYASVAAIGSAEMVFFWRLGSPDVGAAASVVTCTVLGLLAVRRKWILPPAPVITAIPVPKDVTTPWRRRRGQDRGGGS